MFMSKKIFLSPILAMCLVSVYVNATELGKIEVEAEKLIVPTMQANETVYTGSEVTQKGMELQGVKATTSVYETLSILPGVNVENVDSNGLAIEQSTVRMRGVRSSMGALTVEGVPNYGGNPIGPRDYLYDMKNMESLSIYKGGVPADIGTGVGSRGGAITLHPKWAKEAFGFDLSQTVGSNDYTRSYFRLDSGILNESGTRASGAVSYAQADKWRGEGDLGPRVNANFSVVQPIGEATTLKLWYNHNDQEQNLYRPLSYAQTQNLKENYKLDYNKALTGNAAQDIYYYDYNKGEYKNDDLIAVLTHSFNDTYALNLKPYYAKEDTEIYQGTTSGNKVQKRIRDIERYGVMSELEARYDLFKAVVGYHFEKSLMDISTENYAITSSGLSYRGMGVVGTSGDTYLNSPYIKLSGSVGDFNWQGGLKYFRFEDSDSLGYTTSSSAPYGLNRATDLDREGDAYSIVLPTFGVSYNFDTAWQAYANYGKSFIRPYSYLPIMNTYNTYRTQFQAAGVNVQDLFDGYGIEKSDNFDLGVRYKNDNFEIAPTLFYGKHQNLLTNVSDSRVIDPISHKPISYQQNIGKSTSYGVETEINAFITDELTFFVNPTYVHFTYDEDITYQGTTLNAKDNQIVDTPKWMAKTGVIYKIGNIEFIPMARYLGERYGDAGNNDKIDASWLFDAQLAYTKKNFYDKATLKVALEVDNIFDKEYVSAISASDDTRAGAASYYQGAPRSVMLTVGVHF